MQELCNGNQSESPSPIDLEVAALEQCNLHSTFILFHLVNRAVFSLQPPQYDDDDPTLHAHPYMPGGRSGTCKGLYRRASQSLETLLSRFSGQIRSRAIVYIHVLVSWVSGHFILCNSNRSHFQAITFSIFRNLYLN